MNLRCVALFCQCVAPPLRSTVQIESFSFETNDKVKALLEEIVEEAMKPKPDRGGRRGGKRRGEDGGEEGAEIGPDGEPVELGPPPEEGLVYRNCSIVSLHGFGVFVEVLPGYDGLVHVSELDVKRVSVAHCDLGWELRVFLGSYTTAPRFVPSLISWNINRR